MEEKKWMATNILLPEDLWHEAKVQALGARISLSELMRRALRDYLEKQDPTIKKRIKNFGKTRLLKKS